MTCLILTPYFFPIIGGVESNAERLARYLVGEGDRVQVLTKRIDGELPDRETRAGVPVRRIGPRGQRSPAGKWVLIPGALAWLLRHAREYDIVCCIDYRATAVAGLFGRVVTGRPVVVQAQTTGVLSGGNADPMLTSLGLNPRGWIARAIKRPIRALYSRADAIACISHELEREALACGVSRDRVHYFPNAIDMAAFRPAAPGEREALRTQLGLPADRVICLFVGRLSREKGLMELMEAWRQLRPPGALLVVAGPDMTGHPWDAGVSSRRFVEEHGLGGGVRFVGPVEDVASILRAVDLAVQPSHFEALGLSAIEALASGVPVVASAVGGLPEFITDGVNGRLCPPRDPAALAACLGPLLTDGQARARLAARARESVRDEFDERLVFGRMRALFDRLAAQR